MPLTKLIYFHYNILANGLTIRPDTSSQTRRFSTTKIKRMNAEPFVSAAAVVAQMAPQVNWAFVVLSNLSIVVAGVYNIVGDWSLGFIESLFSTNQGPNTEIQNWALAVDVYGSLTDTLHEGVNALRTMMPEILPVTNIEIQNSLLFGLRGLDFLANVAFHESMLWSNDLSEAASEAAALNVDFNANFSDLADDFEDIFWPNFRAAANELRDLIRYVEEALHLVPSDRTPGDWFED